MTNQENVSNKILTVPNLITTLGIFLTVLYIWQFSAEKFTPFIPITVFLVGLSDLLDGFAARRLNQHSILGKILDPLRDRLLVFAILANIFYIKQLTPFILPLLMIILSEAFFYAKMFMLLKKIGVIKMQAHFLAKTRQAIYGICGIIFVIQEYWLLSELASAHALMFSMALASLSLLLLHLGDAKPA